jgi:hypothetical protein
MTTLEVYEPPIGCGVGTCGPEAEEELSRFGAMLESLAERGIVVARFNLGLEPEAFAKNPAVKAAIRADGISCLPIVISNGKVICERRYPAEHEISEQLGESWRDR